MRRNQQYPPTVGVQVRDGGDDGANDGADNVALAMRCPLLSPRLVFCNICGAVHETASISPGATLRDAAADDATDLAGFGDLGHGR